MTIKKFKDLKYKTKYTNQKKKTKKFNNKNYQ